MIVTFKTQPQGNSGDHTAAYMNFLRCVTAIMTAPAGTTALTVNPYTASNTINTGFNCIVSIDSNTEAGGWTTSSAHNVPSSGTNVATTFTTITSTTAFTYKADFYKSSGKTNAACQYLKLCFHSYNSNTETDPHYGSYGYARTAIQNIGQSSGANILITYGHSSSTNWTDTAFPPAAGQASGRWMSTGQTKSKTMNCNTRSGYYNTGPALCYMDTGVQYKMAVTADYCIIWEDNMSTYANGNWQTPTSGAGTTYWNSSRYGGIFYMGTREPQAWENTRDDNPSWVCWNILINRTAYATAEAPWADDGMTAWMATLDTTGVVTAPQKYWSNNMYNQAYFSGSSPDRVTAFQNSPYEGYSSYAVQGLDTLMRTRNWGNGTAYNSIISQPGSGQTFGYLPQIDPITGTWVPGAYPLVVAKSAGNYMNAGGKCRGIYKSLTMNYSDMKRFWQSANQTFTVAGETYMPIVILDDMWLIRVA